MIKTNIAITNILPFLLLSCSHNKFDVDRVNHANAVNVSVNLSAPVKGDIEKLIDKSFYVKLETKNTAIIGSIEKVICDDSLIFVFDKKAECIFIYDFKGLLINKISSKGKGENEYVLLEDFNINKDKKRIEISDAVKRRVLFFNYEGKYVGNQEFKGQIRSHFSSNKEGDFVFHSQQVYKKPIVYTFNNQGELTHSYIRSKYPSSMYSYFPMLHNPINVHDNVIYFMLNGSESIFKVEGGDSCKEAYKLTFGPNKYEDVLKDYFKTKGGFEVMNNFYSNYKLPLIMDNLFFTDKYFVTNIYVLPLYFFYYNMQTGKQLLVKNWDIKDKVSFLPGYTVGSFNDYFISIVDVRQIMSFKKYSSEHSLSKIDNESYAKITNICSTTKKDDNPVLMFYRLTF